MLSAEQKLDSELLEVILENQESSLELKFIAMPDTTTEIFPNASTGKAHSFVMKNFCKSMLSSIHNLAHPRIKGSIKLILKFGERVF